MKWYWVDVNNIVRVIDAFAESFKKQLFVCKNVSRCNFNLLQLKPLPWKAFSPSRKRSLYYENKTERYVYLQKMRLISKFSEAYLGPCKTSMKHHSLFWKESSIIDDWEGAKLRPCEYKVCQFVIFIMKRILCFLVSFTSHALSSKNELPYQVFYFFCDLKVILSKF